MHPWQDFRLWVPGKGLSTVGATETGGPIVGRLAPEEETVAALGIKYTWVHRGFGEGSVCKDATVCGRGQGITVIDGGCRLMFSPTTDFGHKVIRLFTGNGKASRSI
jgi:hypothetical protein